MSIIIRLRPAVVALGIGTLSFPAIETRAQPAGGMPALVNALDDTRGGHPTAGLLPPGDITPPVPDLGQPPLASGTFVNFESPPVKPLALSSNGTRLFAANTPDNRLVVIDSSGTRFKPIRSIPVGLDPVSVAVQPGTGDALVWVVNHISDNVSVVDVTTGEVIDVIPVGDEPVNVVFNDDGTYAFIIIQGSPDFPGLGFVAPLDPVQEGNVIVIETTTRTATQILHLDGNTPRAAAYHAGRLYVAALHSGNNTSVVGVTPLLVASLFNQTKPLFDAGDLAPWPDPHQDPTFPKPSPLVHRIVTDPLSPGPWGDIVDLLSAAPGVPDPLMVQLLAEQIDPDNPPLEDAEALILDTITDAIDTNDHDLFVIDASDPGGSGGLGILNILGGVGTTLTGLAVNPVTGDCAVSNMEARNTVRLEPQIKGHLVDHQIVFVTNTPVPAILPRDLHEAVAGFNDVSAVNAPASAASLANPVDIVFNPTGTRAYVAALGPGRVGVLDTNPFTDGPFVLGLTDVGRGPRGLALDVSKNRLYVLNRTDLTISKVDVSSDAPVVLETLPLFNPEPDVIRVGRDFLYSTRFSNNFASSCAVCHVDGHLDHVAWDLGDDAGELQPGPPNLEEDPQNPLAHLNHPIKGPMVTLSLRGLNNHDPLHWRGDRVDFQAFNAAFEGLLGGSQLPGPDMDAFTDFIHTVNYAPNPFRHRDDTFKDPRALPGTTLFNNRCNQCHQVTHDGALDVEGIDGDGGMSLEGPPLFAQLQLVTQLRGIHKKFDSDRRNGFGLIHDGREEREDNNHPLETFLKQFFPNIGNDPVQSAQMIAFVTAFPTNAMPAIGWQILLDAPVTPDQDADLQLMAGQHAMLPSRCDVVAKTVIAGRPKGYVLVATSPTLTFQSDTDESVTLAELYALAAAGSCLVFTAVPPGSGERIGVNQDGDTLLDGQDPCPQLHHHGTTDFDCDLDVDPDDFGFFQACTTGPAVPFDDPLCTAADTDADLDIDQVDFGIFQRCLSGPTFPADPNCAG